MQIKYIDVGWGLGSVSYELVFGIDCLETVIFLDVLYYYDVDDFIYYFRVFCFFEMFTGVFFRRYFDFNFNGGFNFYVGFQGQVLVLRTILIVYNYDYIWDFIFYFNGVMEVKMYVIGYVYVIFYIFEGLRYGIRLYTYLFGNMYIYLVYYRVDLDVVGRIRVYTFFS